MKIYFASQNRNKISEIAAKLGSRISILSAYDLGEFEELPETGNTLEANAREKARYIHGKFGVDCFADDTGLEVKALHGAPGVYSARYAGEAKNADDNMDLLLRNLDGINHRQACFKTVIVLIMGNKEYVFEGVINGTIITEKRGEKGFGYDPVFVPDGHERTFAEMSLEEKNVISHRAIAVEKFSDFLRKDGLID